MTSSKKNTRGFSQRDALEKKDDVGAAESAQKKLDSEWSIFDIRLDGGSLPGVVVGPIEYIDCHRQATKVGKEHQIAVPAVNASKRKAIPCKTTGKEQDKADFFVFKKQCFTEVIIKRPV